MDPLTLGLIAGGSSLLGSVFSSTTSAQNAQNQIAAQEGMQAQSEQFNASEAEKQRDFAASQVSQQEAFQTQMSNTAYQRAAQDMRSAGLNPILAAGQSSSTPSGGAASGATASVGTPSVPMSQRTSPLGGLGDAVSKVVSTANNVQDYARGTAAIQNIQADTGKKLAEAATEAERPELVRDMVAKMANEMPISRLTGTSANDILTGVNDNVRRWANIFGWGGSKASDAIAPIVNSASAVRGFLPRRSTLQRSTVDTEGRGTDTFEDRWDNLMGSYQR